ncbi:hypothetical protein [Stigmatella aurantiaca]|uniref:Uncharacterized protein n=1 Tax=Stigmatella aurantiaca (strain DW4/3-1) TaxID=378806 RepID=Q08S36_STIAD|nr:hypothetical protein [Stigmatella aurantiaca]EAU63293.1 hypothetical protein STIAU_3150 [Stigmatella aurantiaca DW4/3-1]
MPPAPPRHFPPWATHEQEARAWWGALFATGLTFLSECAYFFIDEQTFPGAQLLPALRVLHVLEALGLLGLLMARRRKPSRALGVGVFVAVVLPYLGLFAVAEAAMASSGLVWMPLTGHRLLMVGIGLVAPTGVALGSALVGTFALEAALLWYGLGLHTRLPMPWEPWITLVWGGVACGLLVFRARTLLTEQRLFQVRAEAESLERLARLLLVLRDATNTPLQSLELGLSLLQQRVPEEAALLATLERAIAKLRTLTQRMAVADPLLDWETQSESFDVDTVLRSLEESLARELARRRQ